MNANVSFSDSIACCHPTPKKNTITESAGQLEDIALDHYGFVLECDES